jgi:hypothetical protein
MMERIRSGLPVVQVGSWRRNASQRRKIASRSRVVSASKDNSKARFRSASSASKTPTTSSRLLANMFEYYVGPPTGILNARPLKPK